MKIFKECLHYNEAKEEKSGKIEIAIREAEKREN